MPLWGWDFWTYWKDHIVLHQSCRGRGAGEGEEALFLPTSSPPKPAEPLGLEGGAVNGGGPARMQAPGEGARCRFCHCPQGCKSPLRYPGQRPQMPRVSPFKPKNAPTRNTVLPRHTKEEITKPSLLPWVRERLQSRRQAGRITHHYHYHHDHHQQCLVGMRSWRNAGIKGHNPCPQKHTI